jgi:peptidoglycan/xylan/chitin deacetylase (PgdA/CDA1 family)
MDQLPSGRIQIASFGYHEVTDDPASSGFQRSSARAYTLSRRVFEEHLEAVGSSGLIPELVSDIQLAGSGRHLLLTFDDGGKSAIYVGGALAARGWRGHFFVVTALLDERRFLNQAEVRLLRSWGHLIGSHSHTHPTPFGALSRSRMVEEWKVSCDRIAQILGEPCTTASVPGGEISNSVPAAAATAGLTHLFTSEPWRAPRHVHGCWMLGRYIPKLGTSPRRVRELAHFQGWGRALLARQCRVYAKILLPLPYQAYARWRARHSTDAA